MNPFLLLDVNQVDLGIYAIHVVAGVLKLFFRTLPSPLITEDVYDEFLRACGEFRLLIGTFFRVNGLAMSLQYIIQNCVFLF